MSEAVASLSKPRTNPCRHIMPAGIQCGSPALRSEKLCYFHTTARRPAPHRTEYGATLLSFPEPEDLHAVQRALGELLRLLAARKLDAREAAPILRTLSIASVNLARMDRQQDRQQARAEANPSLAPALAPVETIVLDPVLGPIASSPELETVPEPASPEVPNQAELLIAYQPEILAPETLPDPIDLAIAAGDLSADPVALFHTAKQELDLLNRELSRRHAAGLDPIAEPTLSTGLALDPLLLYTFALDRYNTHLRTLGLNPDRLEPGQEPLIPESAHKLDHKPAGTVTSCTYPQRNEDFSTSAQVA